MALEAQKMKELQEFKKKQQELKNAPKEVPKPKEEVKEESLPALPSIAPPQRAVKQASAFEDKYSTEVLPPGAADPYEGMSFSEVLKAKREALDKKVESSA